MGTFSKTSRPKLAGTYFNFDITATPVLPPSVGSTVALGITHNWGPLETPTLCASFEEFRAKFGGDLNAPTSGLIAVYEAFKGEGTPDFGGAGGVLVYRIGGTTAAKATKILSNTSAAAAITLSAKYQGTFGNTLRVTTQDHAADATMNELLVYSGSVLLETFVYLDTNITDLAAQINASSAYLTAGSVTSGVALAAVSSQALTGGDDGTTLVAQDYTDAMTTLGAQRFGILAFENLTDGTILASVASWVASQNAAGHRFFLVTGGVLNEAVATAISRSATLNNPDIVNVGVGSVQDTALPTKPTLSSAQLAPRVAGILANRGERYSLTFSKLADTVLLAGPTPAEIVSAFDGGVTVFGRVSATDASVHIEKGITSFITTTDSARPKAIYSQPRYIATMHGLQDDLVSWANDNIIGKTTVDNDTRTAVLGQINTFLRERELLGSIQPGWEAFVDQSPPPSDDDDFIAFVIVAKFGRSTEQVYFTGRLG